MRLEVREARNGRGAFPTAPFSCGSVVVDWSLCPVVTRAEIRPEIEDIYVQVGPNEYVGPSGCPDDYINHSCEPNCEVREARLIALRDIPVVEEITFDYAIGMYDDPWEMVCNCGTLSCRKIIRERSNARRG